MTALVVGIGNVFRQDDGVGVEVARAVARRLRDRSAAAAVEVVESHGEASHLVELWEGRPLVVVIDAICSEAKPGTIEVIDLIDVIDGIDGIDGGDGGDGGDGVVLPAWRRGSTSHDSGLADAIALAGALGRLPGTMLVLTVNGVAFGHGEDLSPPVAAAVEPAVAKVEAMVSARLAAPASWQPRAEGTAHVHG